MNIIIYMVRAEPKTFYMPTQYMTIKYYASLLYIYLLYAK